MLRSLTIQEKTFGPDHPDVSATLNNLGTLYENLADYAKTEQYYLRSLHILEKVCGPNHPALVMTLENLGYLYKNQGNYSKAESYYFKAMKIVEETMGPDHPHTALNYYDIGCINVLGKRAEGLSYFRRSFQLGTKDVWSAFSRNDPDLASLRGDPEFERIKAKAVRQAEKSQTAKP